nr:MAG TPA: hypothetical protein [Caudoviricetes sp.]
MVASYPVNTRGEKSTGGLSRGGVSNVSLVTLVSGPIIVLNAMLNISYLVLHADLRRETSEESRLDQLLVFLAEGLVDVYRLHRIAVQLHASHPRVTVRDRIESLNCQRLDFEEDFGRILLDSDTGRGRVAIKKLHRQTRLSLIPNDPTILEVDPNGVRFVALDFVADSLLGERQDATVNNLLHVRISVELSSGSLELSFSVCGDLCHHRASLPGSFLSASLIEIREVDLIFGLNSALLAHHEPYLAPLPNPGSGSSPCVTERMIQSSPASITVSLVWSVADLPSTKKTILRTYQMYSVVTGSLLPLTVLLTRSPMTVPSIQIEKPE